MTYRPYPNRERALRQVERGRVPAQPGALPTLATMVAYLQSDEHRENMRRMGETLNTVFASLKMPA